MTDKPFWVLLTLGIRWTRVRRPWSLADGH